MSPAKTAAALTAAAAAMVACTNVVEVHAAFPEPLVETLPLRVGVLYTPALSGYVYSEKVRGAPNWTFRLGTASVRLFDRTFTRLFTALQPVNDVAAVQNSGAALDAIVEPAVETVEFSVPMQSHTDQYGVWIRYKLRIYGRDGQLIEEWPVSAYGQSEDRGMSATRSMERAAELAMRDAEATIAVEFSQRPKIRDAFFKEAYSAKP